MKFKRSKTAVSRETRKNLAAQKESLKKGKTGKAERKIRREERIKI
ncbi:MAG: hypothetical protein J7L54_03805 [Elusimicrobia bacterium]|nr:hypothetical protein [Elusimicrobiota bacterium]